jgi:DNA-binding NarL/FixJ family response regulator
MEISMFDASTSVPFSEGRSLLHVALAGSFVSFSDRVLCLLQAEFPKFGFERVDGAILDWPAPTDGLHLLICEEGLVAKALRLSASGRAAVAVAYEDAPSIAARLAALGVDTFPSNLSLLPMNLRLDAWLSVVSLLLHGESYVPVSVLRGLAGRSKSLGTLRDGDDESEGPMPSVDPSSGLGPIPQRLTGQERRILPLIAQGKQNKVIADELALSEHTVKLHVHHIIGKLGLRNRTEVARYYLARPVERRVL